MIADERYTDYINSLQSILPADLEDLYREARKNDVPVIRPETQAYLRFLIREKKPMRILEVGTAIGFSALFMSRLMPEGGRVTTIEKQAERAEEARKSFASFEGGESITLLEGDAAEVLETLEEGSFDLLFMDAAKGQYIRFLPRVKKLLKNGGVLVSDNVLQDGQIIESRFAVTRRDRTIHARMREYLSAICRDPELVTTILTIGDGVAVSYFEKEESE